MVERKRTKGQTTIKTNIKHRHKTKDWVARTPLKTNGISFTSRISDKWIFETTRRTNMWHKQMTVFSFIIWTEIDLFKINIISSLMYDLQTRTIIDKTYYNYFYWTVTIFFHHDYQKEKKTKPKTDQYTCILFLFILIFMLFNKYSIYSNLIFLNCVYWTFHNLVNKKSVFFTEYENYHSYF